FAQRHTQFRARSRSLCRRGCRHLLRLCATFAQALARAGDGEAVRIQELFDLQQLVYVAPRVDPLTLARLLRSNGAKFRLPIAEYVRLDPDDLRHFADSVVELDRQLLIRVGHYQTLEG